MFNFNPIHLVLGLKFINLVISSVTVPGLHAPGCSLIQNTLYVFGGAQALKEQDLSSKIYKLNLDDLSNLIWEKVDVELPIGMLAPNIIKPNVDSNVTYIIGSKNVTTTDNRGNSFKFEVKPDGSTSIDKVDNTLKLKDSKKHQPLSYFPYGGGMVQSDINQDEFIFYSSVLLLNDSSYDYVSKTFIYNLKLNTWKDLKPKGGKITPFYQATFHIYKGVLYCLGGADLPSESLRDLNLLWTYNLKTNTWSELRLNSAVNVGVRNVQSSVLVGNLIYLVGGSDGQLVNDKVLILNLDTMTWSEQKVVGLMAKNQGCLISYKDRLVYTMGFADDFNSTIQVIDPISGSVKINPRVLIPVSIILVIVYCSLAGLGILIGILVFLFIRRRKARLAHEEYLLMYDKNLKEHKDFVEGKFVPQATDNELDTQIDTVLDTKFDDVGLDDQFDNTNLHSTLLPTKHQSNIQNDFKI